MTSKPKCIIVTGPPGAGKTTLAKRLGEHLWMPVVSRDEIKEGYVNTCGIAHDQLPPETNALVSNLFFELVSHYLKAVSRSSSKPPSNTPFGLREHPKSKNSPHPSSFSAPSNAKSPPTAICNAV